MRVYRQTPRELDGFTDLNRSVDDAFSSRLTQKLRQAVNRYGAPFRVMRALTESRSDLPELLNDRQAFLDAYNYQIGREYQSLSKRLNKGIAKSIVFVFVTKVSVGLAIEIPYDIAVLGSVAILPLAVNLLFPPLYMASFKLGLKNPSSANAAALCAYVDKALYVGGNPLEQAARVGSRPISPFGTVVYTIFFIIPLVLLIYVLTLLHFSPLQGIIFFVFLSTASFLGFRLSRISRDMELVPRQARFSGAVRDFFYLPFIVMGRWISSKYARANIVAYVLDVLVELPLKTVLRLVRQWVRFLSEKHEEIL
jgi:hypothetical protein